MQPEVYDQFAAVMADHWWSRARRLRAADLLARMGVRPGAGLKVLEIGCGAGTEHAFLSTYGPVTGLDLDPKAQAYAAHQGYAALLRADLNEYRPEPAAFDLVVSFNVLYHAWVDRPDQVLAALAEGLKPGGIFLATEAAFECLRRRHDEAVMTARRWNRRQFRALVEGAGLEIEELSAYGALLTPALLASVGLERIRGPGPVHEVAELRPLPRPVVAGMDAVMGLERFLARFVSFPFGPTWLCGARKP